MLYKHILGKIALLNFLLKKDDKEINTWIHYQEYKVTLEVTPPDIKYIHTCSGSNATDEPQNRFPIKVSGDSSIDVSGMNATVRFGKNPPKKMDKRHLIYDKAFVKCFEITTDAPLDKGNPLKYIFECTWKGQALRKKDYVFSYPLSLIKQDVDKLIFTVKFEKRPENIVLYNYSYSSKLSKRIKVKKMICPKPKGKQWTYTVEKPKKKGIDSLLLEFERGEE